jgi:hypothetical protein
VITHSQLLTLYATTLADDLTIREWCREYYGRPLQVQVGEDGSDPAGPEGRPLVVLTPGFDSSDMGEESGVHSVAVSVEWEVYEDRRDEVENLKTYHGIKRSDELGQLIRTAIAACTNSVSISRCQYALDPISMHPVYGGAMGIVVEYPNLIGAEMTLT